MKNYYSFGLFYLIIVSLFSCAQNVREINPDKVKVAIRAVGHELLLDEKDFTSLVLPIEEINSKTYKLKFENHLSIDPGRLVDIIEKRFKKADLPSNYIIEVLKCNAVDIAYSYQMKNKKDTDLVPCSGRVLPKSCYFLYIKFQQDEAGFNFWLLSIPIVLIGLTAFLILRRKASLKPQKDENDRIQLGSFIFYPEQHKLIKQATEISLSKKECEILEILSEKPNEIVSREELTKRIWEDNGVVVGRSLDTYISKLRKKLQDDPKIKLTNAHGIGYKLEIE
ncbi:winged helix-turn-helix domain-containing protein [Winogradskyella sp. J14-2]|uniref:winged helix-turn-helix domain-containing protein n=1 Tax=Winogradskyella sp. J14-2 TaxID=1936080 RepID=UPI0018DBA502|nr:winged helix-turn-helix domain-containing protein [Winogradskyella sp. J14-2]